MASLEHGIPITPKTVFYIGSVSKQFTAFAVALLAKQGRISLDDDVRKYIPELPDYGSPITVRHLVHHTGGLREKWVLLQLAGWREGDVVTQQDVLDLARRQKRLDFQPGDRHRYSTPATTCWPSWSSGPPAGRCGSTPGSRSSARSG